MKKNQFKVGDKVICINCSTVYHLIISGKTYKIISIGVAGSLTIKNDRNEILAFMPSRFIKYSDRNKPENEKIMVKLVKNILLGDT